MNKNHFSAILTKLNKQQLFGLFKQLSKIDNTPNCSLRAVHFRKVTDSVMLDRMAVGGRFELSQEVVDFMAVLFLHMYHVWKDRNYFRLTDTLLNRILNTDISNINTKYIVCPYRSMYVEIPKHRIINIDNYFITGLYINYYEHKEPEPIKISKDKTIYVKRYLYFMGVCEDEPLWGVQRTLMLDERTVNSTFKYNKVLHNSIGSEYMVDIIDELVLKLLLYINCSNMNMREIVGIEYPNSILTIQGQKQRKRAMREYKAIYGGNYKLFDVPIVDHYNTPISDIDINGYKLTTPHKVRGHFRQQPYGKNRQNVKTIWIMPYIKGDLSLGFDNTRNYKVG